MAVALLLALTACQPTPPKAERAGAEFTRRKPTPSPTSMEWSFMASSTACHATAAGGKVGLDITMSGHDPIELKLSGLPDIAQPKGRRVAWVFNGSAGHWRLLSAVRVSHDMVAYIGPGETATSKILILLSGGVLAVGESQSDQRRLRLPPSDAAGQAWFDCVRRQR